LRNSLDQVMQENAIFKKRWDNERLLGDTLRREVDSYKQAITELERTMVEMGGANVAPVVNAPSQHERSGSRGR